MDEAQGRMFDPTFDRAVKVEASDFRLTSDGGTIILREVDHRVQPDDGDRTATPRSARSGEDSP